MSANLFCDNVYSGSYGTYLLACIKYGHGVEWCFHFQIKVKDFRELCEQAAVLNYPSDGTIMKYGSEEVTIDEALIILSLRQKVKQLTRDNLLNKINEYIGLGMTKRESHILLETLKQERPDLYTLAKTIITFS